MVVEEDAITLKVFAAAIAADLPESQLTYYRFAGCGHGLVGEKPEEAMQAIRKFIGRLASKS